MKEKFGNLVLIFFCLYSLFFVVGSLLAPLMAHLGLYELSAKLTATYMFSCHQQPTRSFWIMGYPVALCCRCLGFYIGVSLSSIAAFWQKKNLRLKYFISMLVLIIADIFSNYILKFNTGNVTRFCVGIMMGVLFTTLICYIFKHEKGNLSW